MCKSTGMYLVHIYKRDIMNFLPFASFTVTFCVIEHHTK